MAVLEEKFGQQSWKIETDSVSAWVSEQGGMLAPVVFRFQDGRTAEPYHVAPWHSENLQPQPPVLEALRGDFFCLPFGGDNTLGEEFHEPHGESAYGRWTLVELAGNEDAAVLTLRIDYTACSGSVTKRLYFSSDSPVISSEHVLSGFSGAYPLGHHATLHGGAIEGEWKLHIKPFDIGRTNPDFVAPTTGSEYYALEPGADFSQLEELPTRWRAPELTDGSIFPARAGFIDLYAVYRKTQTGEKTRPGAHLAWSTAYNRSSGYLWFQLKDESVLPATVFWVENGGRHQSPWNGRNSCIGIEETCTYFASGRRESASDNAVNAAGIPTAVTLSPDAPTTIRTVQGVIPIEEEPATVTFDVTPRGGLVCRTDAGEIPVPGVDVGWLLGGM